MFARLISTLMWLLISIPSFADHPALTLAKVYQPGVRLNEYLISEKYDGVRAYWNGQQLLARSGKPINAPAEFIQLLPDTAVDGELWFGRDSFGRSAALIHRQAEHPDYLKEWRKVHYMIFDAPHTQGDFKQRLKQLKALNLNSKQLVIAPQWPVTHQQELMTQLKAISAAGAEGLMLRKIKAPYRAGRSDDLLKLKLWHDQEATVLEHLPGKGKYQGSLGALLVRLDDGREIKIGTGFSDAVRQSPPAIGQIITFKHQGVTVNGLPKFPVYWRQRMDQQ